jgi:hypothetical protein
MGSLSARASDLPPSGLWACGDPTVGGGQIWHPCYGTKSDMLQDQSVTGLAPDSRNGTVTSNHAKQPECDDGYEVVWRSGGPNEIYAACARDFKKPH